MARLSSVATTCGSTSGISTSRTRASILSTSSLPIWRNSQRLSQLLNFTRSVVTGLCMQAPRVPSSLRICERVLCAISTQSVSCRLPYKETLSNMCLQSSNRKKTLPHAHSSLKSFPPFLMSDFRMTDDTFYHATTSLSRSGM